MADVITTVNALPLAIKAGWMIWMAWAAAQVTWYRRARVAAAAAQASTPPVARRRPEPRPAPRSEPRPVRQEAAATPAAMPAPTEPASPLPAIDLSDIVAAAERSSARDERTTHQAGSILGLDPRPSAN